MPGLVISKLSTDLSVARGHPQPDDVKRRVDDILRQRLPAALTRAFESSGLAAREDVLFIRRLDLDLDFDAGLDPDQIARQWAGNIARSVVAQLDSAGADSLHFSTPSALLAQYVRDRARGAAENRWYYRTFHGLAMLPASAAIRSALQDVPDTGVDALLSLPRRDFIQVLEALTDSDLRNLEASFGSGSASNLECARAVLQAWRGNPEIPSREALLGLRLFLDSARPNAGLRSRELASIATAFARIASCPDDAVRDAVRRGDLGALYQRSVADAETLRPLLDLEPEIRGEFLEAVTTSSVRETRTTPFGGLFILIPVLEEFFPDSEIAQWPQPQSGTASSLIRFFVLMKCFGGKLAPAFCADPLVQDLLGAAPESLAQAAPWLAGMSSSIGDTPRQRVMQALQGWRKEDAHLLDGPLSDADREHLLLPKELGLSEPAEESLDLMARYLLRLFARRLPGFGQSSFSYLVSNFLDFPVTVISDPVQNRLQVRTGRPPLSVVLGITGMLRQSYAPSWAQGQEWRLYPEA